MAVVEVPEELNLAAVHEAIAAAVPDRECLVWRDRRLTWADVTDRSRRLAAVLRDAGLGVHRPLDDVRGVGVAPRPRRALPPQRQRVPRGACSAPPRPAPSASTSTTATWPRSSGTSSSTAGARAIVYHGAFAPTLARGAPLAPRAAAAPPGRRRHPTPRSSRAPSTTRRRWPPPSPRPPERPQPRRPLHPLHRRHHRACPRACCGARPTSSPRASGSPRPPSSSSRAPGARACGPCPPPPFMHGAAHWNALSALDERRHGRRPGRPGPARPPRRARHGRAGAGHVAAHRGRRLRPAARRRAARRATTTSRACATSSPAAPRCRPT